MSESVTSGAVARHSYAQGQREEVARPELNLKSMNPKSDNLFHYTKNIDNLKSILLNGFMPRYCKEDIEWLKSEEYKFIAYPMICFCDIPISRISKHTSSFGEYGIGMSKKWGISNDLTPVIYVTTKSAVPKLTNYLFCNWKFTGKGKKTRKRLNLLWQLISLTKPINGKVIIRKKEVNIKFYQENEWRYVPKNNWDVLIAEEYEERKDALNAELECQKITFIANEVEYIFVKNNQEILEMFDFIHEKLSHMSENDRKILSTKIISMETLNRDI
jgi:hypothetical protein